MQGIRPPLLPITCGVHVERGIPGVESDRGGHNIPTPATAIDVERDGGGGDDGMAA